MQTHPRIRRSRRLQTPVNRYSHPDTGRRITIVATSHVGEPAYYEQLRAVIDSCRGHGAVVHTEGGAEGSQGHRVGGELTDLERKAVTERHLADALMTRRAAELGLVHQSMGLNDPGWYKIDLPVVEVIRGCDTEAMLDRFRTQRRQLDWDERDKTKPNLYRLALALAYRVAASNRTWIREATDVAEDAVLIDERNRVAFEAVLSTDQDVVLVWGVKHLRGFDSDLTIHGYVCDRQQWHTAMRLPSILAALANMIVRRRPHPGKPAAPALATEQTGEARDEQMST